ncbi:MAG: hypothetical protein FWF90_09660 [Promicromonosporaceae bacterium]|nr:hypothetical protein [Promicromonosporaceae bacterium]
MARTIVVAVLLAGTATWLVLAGIVDWPHAAVTALAGFALYLVLTSPPVRDRLWPGAPREDRPGGRSGVSELGWAAFTRDGMTTEHVLRRVRALAVHRLALHGVVWDGARSDDLAHWGRDGRDSAAHREHAEALLGRDVVAGLTSAHQASPHMLEIWFRSLDHLVEAPHDPRSPR